MKWRIAEKKLLFFRKIMLKEESNITRRALMNEMFMGLKGLSHECRQLTEMMGIPDIMANLVSIGEIKQAVARHSNQEMTDEIQSSTKVGDRWSEDPLDNTYLKYMSLPNSRIWMRYRARSIKGVKVNNKRSYTNLSCRYCDEGSQETQEHIETCGGCKFERRGLDISGWVGLVIFWRRMTAKLADTAALEHVGLMP